MGRTGKIIGRVIGNVVAAFIKWVFENYATVIEQGKLLKPIISTLFVLDFMAVWNDFTMPLYYLNNSKQDGLCAGKTYF